MAGKRTRHSADFKARVALEAIKGMKTVNELGAQYGVHPTQVSQWKRQLQDGVKDIFASRRAKVERDQEALRATLYEEIGWMKVESIFAGNRESESAAGARNLGQSGLCLDVYRDSAI